jgi:chromosome partitioning protein
MIMTIIAIYNRKGGVAKTTTAINLAAALANNQKRVLLIDNAPQANATAGVGVNPSAQPGIAAWLTDSISVEKILIHDVYQNLDLIPSDYSIDRHSPFIDRFSLSKHLSPLATRYDFIIIDNDPTLDLLTENALYAADTVLIPLRIDKFALDGYRELRRHLKDFEKETDSKLKILGILLTQYESRTRVMKGMRKELQSSLGDLVFQTTIRKNIQLVEAPFLGRPIFDYAPRANGAIDYESLAQEVLHRTKKQAVS